MADSYTGDWTRGVSGNANSSAEFERLAGIIADDHLWVGAAAELLNRSWVHRQARGILAALAHRHGLRPR